MTWDGVQAAALAARKMQQHQAATRLHTAPTWTACRLLNCLALGLSPDSYSGTWPYCSLAPYREQNKTVGSAHCG